MKKRLVLFVVLIFTAGCGATSMYHWGGYEGSLYQYYKEPAKSDKFMGNLKKTIARGEKKGNVAPGLYAEYGYILYEKQKYKEAIEYFDKEKTKWPESQLLMEKMINNAQKAIERKK